MNDRLKIKVRKIERGRRGAPDQSPEGKNGIDEGNKRHFQRSKWDQSCEKGKKVGGNEKKKRCIKNARKDLGSS